MKTFTFLFVLMFTAGLTAFGQSAPKDLGLPDLHVIKTVVLSPSYSCRDNDEFTKGYGNTALFISAYAKDRNSPDLLFNGACRSEDYFTASTAGDDMSLIADLGAELPVEEISASRAFNLKRVHSFAEYSKFAQLVKVQAGHTYAVLLNASDRRGLLIFTVDSYVPNEKVEIRYTVKMYNVADAGRIAAPGFDWEKKSQ
ncbi:MAG: hypothetical protein QUS14_07930 [Pyrinomonadaceae bacterium]|nr:hypothetical protein [Pyrinomonadaceae bacterium]